MYTNMKMLAVAKQFHTNQYINMSTISLG